MEEHVAGQRERNELGDKIVGFHVHLELDAVLLLDLGGEKTLRGYIARRRGLCQPSLQAARARARNWAFSSER